MEKMLFSGVLSNTDVAQVAIKGLKHSTGDRGELVYRHRGQGGSM